MEAAPGFEPGISDLQSDALATWLCRLVKRGKDTPRGGSVKGAWGGCGGELRGGAAGLDALRRVI